MLFLTFIEILSHGILKNFIQFHKLQKMSSIKLKSKFITENPLQFVLWWKINQF